MDYHHHARLTCREIGRASTLELIERTGNPSIPAREILLPFEIIIRQSSG
jgi:DNA-binding LacI/PurR family transcriptional regulator